MTCRERRQENLEPFTFRCEEKYLIELLFVSPPPSVDDLIHLFCMKWYISMVISHTI